MKKLLFALCVAVLCAGRIWAANEDVVDGVVAIVNDRIITYSDLQEIVGPLLPRLRSQFSGDELIAQAEKLQKDALDTLIDRTLIIQEFTSKGYQLPDSAADEQINEIIDRQYNGNRAALIKSLEAEHTTFARYREQMKERVIVQAMTNRKQFHDFIMSPYKIEKYFKDHQDEFKEEDKVKLRMLVIKKNPAAPEVPKKLAAEILAKLDAGDSFESLTKVYSEAKDAKTGGDWGWVTRKDLREELKAAFTLKAGQHSRIIETQPEKEDPGAYYILRVEDVRPTHVTPLTEVRDEIEKKLREEQRAKLQDVWIKQLRNKAYIRTF